LISLGIYYANQCDKNKCTSIKIHNKKDKLTFPVYLFSEKKRIRKNSIILTPHGKILLPSDKNVIETRGLTVLDCSWKKNDSILHYSFSNGRKLPKLLAGNPVNYGRWDFLTSMEAVFSSLFITGFESEATKILNLLPWGKTFWDLNKNLLQAYQVAENEQSYQDILKEFF
jgi:pre-rRNA-processing protein TSR3